MLNNFAKSGVKGLTTYHQFRKAGIQFLLRGHGGAELEQLQGNTVLQVDLWGLAAAEAAQEAQAGPRALPGRHPLRAGWAEQAESAI